MTIPGIKDSPDPFNFPAQKPTPAPAPAAPEWKPIERGSVIEKDQSGNLRTNDPKNDAAMMMPKITYSEWISCPLVGQWTPEEIEEISQTVSPALVFNKIRFDIKIEDNTDGN